MAEKDNIRIRLTQIQLNADGICFSRFSSLKIKTNSCVFGTNVCTINKQAPVTALACELFLTLFIQYFFSLQVV